MTTLFSAIAATIITIPMLGYLLFFVIAKQITKNHQRAVRLSMDISTLLFIVSVHYLILAIWGESLFWLLLLIMIALAVLVVIVHYQVKGEIVIHKVAKGFWRINFAFFCCAYFVLVLCGIVYRVAISFI